MKPNARGLAIRLHNYMSSPDYEGGDGPATALGKIEAAIRREYEPEIERLEQMINELSVGISKAPADTRYRQDFLDGTLDAREDRA